MTIRPDDFPESRDADRISDQIIDMANREIRAGVSPLQVFAGAMLGLLGIIRSAPRDRPLSMHAVELAVTECLKSILRVIRKTGRA